MRALRPAPFLPALALLVALAPPAARAGVSAWTRTAPLFAGADSLQQSGAWSAAEPRLDSLAALARVRHDRGMELAALIRTARGRAETFRPDEGAGMLEPLIPELAARRDTMLMCRALRALVWADFRRRHYTEAVARCRRVARLAVLAHLPADEAAARIGIAENALAAGHNSAAVGEFRRAVRLLQRSDDRRLRLAAHAGLARALQEAGDPEGARREHAMVLPEAVALGDRNTIANTEFNLGVLEQTLGDRSLAPAHYEAALAIARQIGRRELVLRVAQALAILYLNAGQHAQADSVLSRVMPEAERSPDVATRALLLSQFGILRRQQGRVAEGIEYGRRAIALTDSLPVATALSLTAPFVFTLRDAGRDEEALALLRSQRERLGSRLDDDARNSIGQQEAGVLLRLGRPREAIVRLRPGLAAGEGPGVPSEKRFMALLTEVRCLTALGERDSALAAYAHAASYWELLRAAQPDPDWRERTDNMVAEFAGAYGIALLSPARGGSAEARAREAFETLQRFRARTLNERLSAPGRAAPAPPPTPSLAEFQRRGLRSGELFLDVHAGLDTTIVFAVTRDTIHAWGLSPRDDLVGRLRRLRSLVSDPTAETPELRAQAAASLGADLLGPAVAELARTRRVLIAAGSLAQYPFGCLMAPGAHAPLAVEREIAFAPSAALLLRTRAGAPPAAPSRRALLAVAFERDDTGHAIPDASKEARWLAARFAGADARVDDQRVTPTTLSRVFAGYDALHFATHMRENVSRPWQSAMFVGGSRERPTWLTAADVARLRAPVRLCVLAGCRSLGGQGWAKETLQGLSTAWLTAGARTVIATVWDADDEATRSLVRAFYEELARGRSASGPRRPPPGTRHAGRRLTSGPGSSCSAIPIPG
jgi:tetratricopeptide (TPR) repeat protein